MNKSGLNPTGDSGRQCTTPPEITHSQTRDEGSRVFIHHPPSHHPLLAEGCFKGINYQVFSTSHPGEQSVLLPPGRRAVGHVLAAEGQGKAQDWHVLNISMPGMGHLSPYLIERGNA